MTIVDNAPACIVTNVSSYVLTCWYAFLMLSETIKMGEKEKDPLKSIILQNIEQIEEYISTTEGMWLIDRLKENSQLKVGFCYQIYKDYIPFNQFVIESSFYMSISKQQQTTKPDVAEKAKTEGR